MPLHGKTASLADVTPSLATPVGAAGMRVALYWHELFAQSLNWA